jgi:hypothetical protein
MVEAEHRVSTLKLVDSVAEQALLEELIERAKPPRPADLLPGLHYLLATPFRYPPLRHGSRFGSRCERGIWYGSETPRTALAEVAYYRLRFLDGTDADAGDVSTDHSLFSARVGTQKGIDLTLSPFVAHEGKLSSPTSYAASQPLGRSMRESGIEAVRYRSARDPGRGVNVAIFDPRAFASRHPFPRALPVWHCTARRSGVVFRRCDLLREETLEFPSSVFLVGGRLPVPGS